MWIAESLGTTRRAKIQSLIIRMAIAYIITCFYTFFLSRFYDAPRCASTHLDTPQLYVHIQALQII
jgi:hypothetical protein